MTAAVKLTAAQARALVKLVELTDAAEPVLDGLPVQEWFDSRRICRSVQTADALERRGLIHCRRGYVMGRHECRLLHAGRDAAG